MNRIALVFAILIVGAFSLFAQAPRTVSLTDEMLKLPSAADWPAWRRDRAGSGYSPLDQINRRNVRNLRLAWAGSMESGSLEPEPLVFNGIMYLPHPGGFLQALDARNGTPIWEYQYKKAGKGVPGLTRNIALYHDMVILGTPDAHLVALDAVTGRVVWDVEVADASQGFRYTAGPVAGDGRIFASTMCTGEGPAHCFLSAHDASTGKMLWKRETVAGPSDSAEVNATWKGVPYERRLKASMWMAGSYDPNLKLVYWTTASAFPYTEVAKGATGGTNLYTQSILALRADTGAIAWYKQLMPRDNFDLDHADSPILADVAINGARHKVVFTMGKPSVLWALDRESGEHLWHRQLVPFQNIYKDISASGDITVNEEIIPETDSGFKLVCPGMRGGKIFQANSYNPRADVIFSSVSLACSNFEILPLSKNRQGFNWDKMEAMKDSNGNVGRLVAVRASTGEILWHYDQRAPMGSSMTTAGGLVFAGDFYRNFRAFDTDTGKILWQVPLNGPIEGYPISYAVDGTQYIAVAAGGASAGSSQLEQLYPELKTSIKSNVLMVFALER